MSNESDRPNEDSSRAENLTMPINASIFIASSSHCDQDVSHRNTVDQTGTREPRELRRSQAADSLRNSTPSETQDRSDTPANASTRARRSLEQQSTQAADGPRTSTFAESQERSGISTSAKSSAIGDIMASLNRKIDRTLEEIRRRTLQRVQDGALDDIVNGPMREAAKEVFNSALQPSGSAQSQQPALAQSHSITPQNHDTDRLHGRLSLESVPSTITEQNCRPADDHGVATSHSFEAVHGTLAEWPALIPLFNQGVLGTMRDGLVGASNVLYRTLAGLAPIKEGSRNTSTAAM